MSYLLRTFLGKIDRWTLRIVIAMIAVALLVLAAFAGRRASRTLLFLPIVGVGSLMLLRDPVLGLPALIMVALVVPIEIGTGTQVPINPTVLLVPALLAIWLLDMVRRRELWLVPSRLNRPLLLFVGAATISLIAGNALWDPAVPRPGNLLAVGLGQWSIFVFSAGAFLLAANLIRDEVWLRRLTFGFLALAGSLVVLWAIPGIAQIVERVMTFALYRAPFWICLVALAGGQLFFNRQLSKKMHFLLMIVLAVALYYAFVVARDSISTWAPLLVVFGVLVWLRFPRLRWLLVVTGVVGVVFFRSSFYEFAGGDAEWESSGASRLLLISRVIGFAMRNPILGVGMATYRHYGFLEPLKYERALWQRPNISSHNNYVDIFAQTGIIGLGLFLWFLVELFRLNWRLRKTYRDGFMAGYVNSMLAALAAICAAMMLLDWFLPFVYNVGFRGFQASVLLWMFLGGLVAVESWYADNK